MSGKTTGKRGAAKKHGAPRRAKAKAQAIRNDWERVDAMAEEEVRANAASDPSNPPRERGWFAAGRLVAPSSKTMISMRVDDEVLDWFRASGRLYQSRMNDVLRKFMEHHRKTG